MKFERREWLQGALSSAAGLGISSSLQAAVPNAKVAPKNIAIVLTAFAKMLHADVIITKILRGWGHDDGPKPALKIRSLYVDQYPKKDLARVTAAKHKIPIFETIEGAITMGSKGVAVDGVISIGEHGKYPYNDIGQHLYPRRRFFTEITNTFEKYGKVVPVFNDKHLGPQWKDAIWMYKRAQQMKIPFMGGSSLPVTFRKPDIPIPMNCEIEDAVGIGYSGLDIYGSHTLDCFQCLLERRKGAEKGVRWVQCLQGKEMWKTVDKLVSPKILKAALSVIPTNKKLKMRELAGSAMFLFQYVDGFVGKVLMLPGYCGGIGACLKIKGRSEYAPMRFEERFPLTPHFAYLLKGAERMFHTGKPSYPVERVLLTGGILDRALRSRKAGGKKRMTPELAIQYTPVDYPHAPHMKLTSDPRKPL